MKKTNSVNDVDSHGKRHWNRVKTTFFTTGVWNSAGAITVNEMISFLFILDVVRTSWAGRLIFINFIVTCTVRGRNEARWRPGQEASLAPHVRAWGLSEANALYWRKYMWHCWDFSAPPQSLGVPALIGAPIVTRRRGIAPPLPTPRYAPWCRVLPFSALLQLHAKSPSQFPHM